MPDPITFTLIVVLSTSEVKLTQNIASLQTCEQARSIVLTGNTIEKEMERRLIEENKARLVKEEETRLDNEWNQSHPWRDPKSDDEKKTATNNGYACAVEAKDGKVRERRKNLCGTMIGYGTLYSVSNTTPTIKYAACVIEPMKEKK